MIAVVLVLSLLRPDLSYTSRTIEGWNLSIRTELLDQSKNDTETAIKLLAEQLKTIKKVVPRDAVKELQKVSLWFSPEYSKFPPRAEYHPGAEWLRENGRNPTMAKGIEFTNIRIFPAEVKRMPVFVLHELAHAYHDQVLGFDNADIKAAYEKAKTSGTYDRVLRSNGKTEKAYAMTNAQEYFAEGTEAFFGTNDFYPFKRDDLKSADPTLFKLLQTVWSKR